MSRQAVTRPAARTWRPSEKESRISAMEWEVSKRPPHGLMPAASSFASFSRRMARSALSDSGEAGGVDGWLSIRRGDSCHGRG